MYDTEASLMSTRAESGASYVGVSGLSALFGRKASRDLFDAHYMLRNLPLDDARLRLGFVVYGGFNRRDWRTVSLDDIVADPVEVERQLLPLLRTATAPD